MSKIIIRRAALTDVEALVPLVEAHRKFREAAPDPVGTQTFLHERISRDETVIFVAFEGASMVGFTQIYRTYSTTLLAPVYLINELWVLPHLRKNGLGTELEAAAIEHARQAGAVRLTMATVTGDAIPQSVYAAAGWLRDHRLQTYHFHP
jgi:GNAT superfamily N-acetyltransferase